MIYDVVSGQEFSVVLFAFAFLLIVSILLLVMIYDDDMVGFKASNIFAVGFFFYFCVVLMFFSVGKGYYNTRIEDFDKYMSICTYELKYVQCSTDSDLYNAYTKISEEDFAILLEERKSQ